MISAGRDPGASSVASSKGPRTTCPSPGTASCSRPAWEPASTRNGSATANGERPRSSERALAQLRMTQDQLVMHEKLASLGTPHGRDCPRDQEPVEFRHQLRSGGGRPRGRPAANSSRHKQGPSGCLGARRGRGASGQPPAVRREDRRARQTRRQHRPRHAHAFTRPHAANGGRATSTPLWPSRSTSPTTPSAALDPTVQRRH